MKKTTSVFCAVLLLALLVSPLAACGAQDGRAASVRLARAQGSVSVWDESEKSLEPRADLGLYDGYRMATAAGSCGWLSLDKERLAKLDAQSEMAVTRAGRQLELTVNAGSLFFNIDTPLAADETLDIRTSNMVVGIRGTCGWVSVTETGSLRVCLLEGEVACTVTQEDGETSTQTVRSGEQGELLPDGTITVTPLCREDVPDFVLEELTQEPELTQTLPARDEIAGPAGAGGPGDGLFADGADDADPMAPYAEALSAMPVSDGTSLGLLLAEVLDFEGDEDPELLVVTVEEPRYVSEDPAYQGPYIVSTIYRGRIAENAIVMTVYEILLPGESISLAEANGQLFLHVHKKGSFVIDAPNETYYGPAVYLDEWWYWSTTDDIAAVPAEGQYMARAFDALNNISGEMLECSQAEYEAIRGKYSDLRVLAGNSG